MLERQSASHGTDTSQVRAIVTSVAHDVWRMLSSSPVLTVVLLVVVGVVLFTMFRATRRLRHHPVSLTGTVVRSPRGDWRPGP
jgi:hypothetical protein